MANFIIVTPPYVASSFGVKTLHNLAHTLNSNGHNARLLFFTGDDFGNHSYGYLGPLATNPEYNTPTMSKTDGTGAENDIVVYPEIVSDNPLKAKNVVRYFLNADGKLTGKPITRGPNDFILSFSEVYVRDAHCFLGNQDFNPVFNDTNSLPITQRTLDLTYIGKGHRYGKVSIIKNSVLITRDSPQTQEQLAQLLRHTRYLYTWDAICALNVETVLCGAMPVFMRYDPLRSEDMDASYLGRLPRLDLNSSNFQFDPEEYSRTRLAMMSRIEEVQQSWPQRVRKFAEAAERHFFGQAD